MFVTGRGSDRRSINIAESFESLGPEKCLAILGFHAFTGCDQTSKFSVKSKLSCWKAFTSANKNILNAFTDLGNQEGDVDESVIKGLEIFVVQLYLDQTNHLEMSLPEARWFLYTKFERII